MATFIKLHAASRDTSDELLVNLDRINFMRSEMLGSKPVTQISFSDRSSIYVRESLKDIPV